MEFEPRPFWNPLGYHLICGPSPRGGGMSHATVGRNGEIVHDPHPDGTGVVKVECFGLFVALNPDKWPKPKVESDK